MINLGIAFGAGVYEHRVVLSRWLRASHEFGTHWDGEAACNDDTGRKFWGFVITAPLTLFTVANLVTARRAPGSIRGGLAAVLAAFADRALTFSYFIPAMVGLMRATDSPQAVAGATRWRNLNYLRLAIVFVAWLASLRTFSLLYQQWGRQ